MHDDVDRFVARFAAFGAQPSVTRYLALFDPDATLFDSGMERPITVGEIPEHIEGILKRVPDFRMTPERWRVRDGTLFVEAHNRASLRDRAVEWPSIYCITLRGDRVLRGRRYYDRRPLVSRVFPGVPPEAPFAFDVAFDPARVAQPALDVASFVRERIVVARSPGAELDCVHWAGDGALVFFEWRARIAAADRRIELGVAERFDLADGRVVARRGYFDSLALDPG